MSKEFTRQNLITANRSSATNSSANLNGDVLDMSGFQGVCFIGVRDSTDAAASIWMQQGTASGSLTDTSGRVTQTQKAIYLDVFQPTMQYVRGVYQATTTGKSRTLLSIQYGAKVQPTTQPASTTGSRAYSPATSTATSS